MKNVFKAAAVVASLVPVGAGWVYTAGATVGDGVGGTAHHTVDVFAVDGYELERENVDGTVTEVVRDPSGAVVDIDEIPADIADELRATDNPPPGPFEIQWDGDRACYVNDPTTNSDVATHSDFSSDDGVGYSEQVSIGDEGAAVLRAHVADSGELIVDAVYSNERWTEEMTSATEGARASQAEMLEDLPGAMPMEPCS